MSTDFVETWKKLKYSEFEKLSDDDLRSIVLNNARKIMALPVSPTPAQIAESQRLLAEQRAANEILTERKETHDKLEASVTEWEKQQKEVPYDNFLKLKAASSANGQLVAAILEDEGAMSAADLAGWCEELASLEDLAFKELLDELVKERVLTIKNDKYRLLHVCTQTLYSDNPVERGIDLLKQSGVTELGLSRLILTIMNVDGEPVNAATIIEKRGDYSFLQGQEDFTAEVFDAEDYQIKACLLKMCMAGVTQQVQIDGAPFGDSFYYFYRLGSYNNLKSAEERKMPVTDGKMTVVQRENETYKMVILDYMEAENRELTLTDIMEGCPEASALSNQRVAALLRQMVEAGTVNRTEHERKAYFTVAEKED